MTLAGYSYLDFSPRFGAQARVHGLMTQLARRHDPTAVTLAEDELDVAECRQAMQAYCGEDNG
jgi:hypothetical protein